MFSHLPNLQTAPFIQTLLGVQPADMAPLERALSEAQGGRTRPLVVIDTNVLLDFWVWDDADARPLKDDLTAGRIVALRSIDTVLEFADVISRPQFKLSLEAQCDILRAWHDLAYDIPITETAQARCKDRDDQKFLNLARTARADYLVSKDKLVLKTAKRSLKDGFSVIKPTQWLHRKDD